MKNILLSSLIIILVSYFGFSQVNLPEGAKKKQPGNYDLTITLTDPYAAKEGVKGELYIPVFKEGQKAEERPLVYFIHGGTRDKTYYKSSANNFMKKWADEYGFCLVNLQNWWMLANDDPGGHDDTKRAANLLSHELTENGIGRKDAVYLTGFSAGGLAAVYTIMGSFPDPLEMKSYESNNYPLKDYFFEYAGFASMKGNFYAYDILPNGFVDPGDQKEYYQIFFNDKICYLTVGGANEAARVKVQAPEAKQILGDYFGLPVIYKEFPNEGHSFTLANWTPFWEMVEEKLAKEKQPKPSVEELKEKYKWFKDYYRFLETGELPQD
jgi:hypothetical protein